MTKETKLKMGHDYAEVCQGLAVRMLTSAMNSNSIDRYAFDVVSDLMNEFKHYTKDLDK